MNFKIETNQMMCLHVATPGRQVLDELNICNTCLPVSERYVPVNERIEKRAIRQKLLA